MSSAVNVLTNNPNILDLIQRDVIQLNFSWNNGKLGYKSDALKISAVFGIRENVDSRRVFWNRSFMAFK